MILFERRCVRILAGTATVMIAGVWDQCGFVKCVWPCDIMRSNYPETLDYLRTTRRHIPSYSSLKSLRLNEIIQSGHEIVARVRSIA